MTRFFRGPYPGADPRGLAMQAPGSPLARRDGGTHLYSGYPPASAKQKLMTLTSKEMVPQADGDVRDILWKRAPNSSGKAV